MASEMRDIRASRRSFDDPIMNYPNNHGFVIGQEYRCSTGGLNGIIEIAGIASNGCWYYVNEIASGCMDNGSFQFNSMVHESLKLLK